MKVTQKNKPPKLLARQLLSQNAPVSGTKYTIMDTKSNITVYTVSIKITWTVQPNPGQIWLTIDGQTIECYIFNPASATEYTPNKGYWDQTNNRLGMTTLSFTANTGFLIAGQSVKIEMETTGGTVSNITGWAIVGQG